MNIAEFNTNQFSYKNKGFFEEASTLQLDSIPDVILLTSEKSGEVRKFNLTSIERDGSPDDEIVAWEYREPIPYSIQGLYITIFND